ncbi:MAG: glycosyltransferase [Cyclobacteriaceae bacterium]|nr:glycosyltransferase [Cyclobacteriaceae bacterium]
MENIKKIAIVVPSLKTGGMEKVASVLANEFSHFFDTQIHVITLSKQDIAFGLDSSISIYQPDFNTSHISFISALIKSIYHVRSWLNKINPYCVISFGDRYNSLIILASIGLSLKVFVSNRQNPLLSNGFFIDLMNKVFYPFATGIVAQTEKARCIFLNKYRHRNIEVIPNPIRFTQKNSYYFRKPIILNVGRFADSKNQFDLVHYFNKLETDNWSLLFIGEGHKKHLTELALKALKEDKKVEIKGFSKNLEEYYLSSSIFAFTSRSEGFPNALGEAMAAGMAVIAYDCIAGPSDLIDNGINGFLVPVDNDAMYIQKLQELINNKELREIFGRNAREKMKRFDTTKIAKKFYNFMFAE